MLNKRAYLVLIRLRTRGLRLLVPLSLVVLAEAINALADLAGVFSPLIKLPRGLRLNDLIRSVKGLLAGLRGYHNLNLVSVETDEATVRIDIY